MISKEMISDDGTLQIEEWKTKNLIKTLSSFKGNGTSMISLYIPSKEKICDIIQMMKDQLGKAENIKSALNRNSVKSALVSVRERLKLYSEIPSKGLVIFSGNVYESKGKADNILIDFEPFKPLVGFIYHCDSNFNVGPLEELLRPNVTYGFIVIDGNGALFGKLSGNYKEIVFKYNVDLLNKHGRGGQSQKRSDRLAEEQQQNYLSQVSEQATKIFITKDRPNVAGLIVAGSASFQIKLAKSDLFDQRLKPKILKVVTVSHGGEEGFNQAIEMSQSVFIGLKYVEEIQLLGRFLKEVSTDSKLYTAIVKETMFALTELNAVDHLILHEDLDIYRIVLRSKKTKKNKVIYLPSEKIIEEKEIIDPETQEKMEVIEKDKLSKWLAENYTKLGVKLSFVSNSSPEGVTFVKEHQGIGAFLRYQINFDVVMILNGIGKKNDGSFEQTN